MATTVETKSIEAKVVIIGSPGVGKTTICRQYIDGVYVPKIHPTVGASYMTSMLNLGSYKIKLEMWDTAGQERFRSMTPMYYRNSDAALLVYDITSTETFTELIKFRDDTLIVGNKIDRSEDRTVSEAEARILANGVGADYIETSALTSEGITEAFQMIGRHLVNKAENKNYRRQRDKGVNLEKPARRKKKCLFF